MQKLLRIDSSMRVKGSYGRMYGDLFLHLWKKKNPGASIRYRDLANDRIPHLDQAAVDAFSQGENGRGALELSDRLIGELIESDVLLIVCPTYNFGIPSVLKAYIDHIVRSRVTFVLDPEKGYRGLMGGKKAYLISSMGNQRSEGPNLEPFEAHLHQVLRFIGIKDIVTLPIYGTADREFIENHKAHFTQLVKQAL